MDDAPDCEQGLHGDVIAAPPIENETDIEVNYICQVCGQIEYTESWTKAAYAKAHPPTRTEGAVTRDVPTDHAR